MTTSLIPVNQTARIVVKYSATTQPTYTQEIFVNRETTPVVNVHDTAKKSSPFLFNFNINTSAGSPNDWVLAGIGMYSDGTSGISPEIQIIGYTTIDSTGPLNYVPLATSLSIPKETYLSFMTVWKCNVSGVILSDSTAASGSISFTLQYYSPSLAAAGKTMPISCDPPIINDQ